MSGYREPVEKLPLIVRKNWRDKYEAEKPKMEENLSKILGTAWTVKADPNLLFAYTEPKAYSSENFGGCITSYLDTAIRRIKDFVQDGSHISYHGKEGITELNDRCTAHVLTILPDTKKKVSYCGCEVVDGELRIIFAEDKLGSNDGDSMVKLEEALSQASDAEGLKLSYKARHGISKKWKEEELLKGFTEQLGDSVKLNPDWEANFAKLSAAKGVRDDWQQNLGGFTWDYFEAVLRKMKNQKFKDDEMLREGFVEAVDKMEIVFRVVDKLEGKGNSYNECYVEGGKFILATKADSWGSNVSDVANKLVDQL